MPGTAAGRSEIPPGERDGDWHSHSDTVAVQDSDSGCKTPVLERSTQLYARHARGCILFISFPGPGDGSNKQLLSRDKELRIMVLYCLLFARLINARHWPHNKKRTSDGDEKMHTRVRRLSALRRKRWSKWILPQPGKTNLTTVTRRQHITAAGLSRPKKAHLTANGTQTFERILPKPIDR